MDGYTQFREQMQRCWPKVELSDDVLADNGVTLLRPIERLENLRDGMALVHLGPGSGNISFLEAISVVSHDGVRTDVLGVHYQVHYDTQNLRLVLPRDGYRSPETLQIHANQITRKIIWEARDMLLPLWGLHLKEER
jgi:hypothetical protein